MASTNRLLISVTRVAPGRRTHNENVLPLRAMRCITCLGPLGHSQSGRSYLHFADGEAEAQRGADSPSWERSRLKSCACLERGELGMNPAEPGVHNMNGSSSQTRTHRGSSAGRVQTESQALDRELLEEAHTLPSKSGTNPCGGTGREG